MADGDVAELTVLAKHNRALVTRPRLWGAVRVVDLAGAQRRIASLLKVLRKAYPLRSGVPEAVDTDDPSQLDRLMRRDLACFTHLVRKL